MPSQRSLRRGVDGLADLQRAGARAASRTAGRSGGPRPRNGRAASPAQPNASAVAPEAHCRRSSAIWPRVTSSTSSPDPDRGGLEYPDSASAAGEHLEAVQVVARPRSNRSTSRNRRTPCRARGAGRPASCIDQRRPGKAPAPPGRPRRCGLHGGGSTAGRRRSAAPVRLGGGRAGGARSTGAVSRQNTLGVLERTWPAGPRGRAARAGRSPAGCLRSGRRTACGPPPWGSGSRRRASRRSSRAMRPDLGRFGGLPGADGHLRSAGPGSTGRGSGTLDGAEVQVFRGRSPAPAGVRLGPGRPCSRRCSADHRPCRANGPVGPVRGRRCQRSNVHRLTPVLDCPAARPTSAVRPGRR